MTDSSNIKVAAIGAGAWGKNLVRNLSQMGVLAAVAEASDGLRASLAAEYPDVPLHGDYRAVIEDPAIDAVTIATPVQTHFEIAAAALGAGKDVFVEKPMTMSSDEASRLIELAGSQNRRVLMVGHLLLYQPAIQWIKQQLDAGIVGKVYSMHQERMKLGRARSVENVTWSLGVHDLAVLLYLNDETPEAVLASGHRGLQAEIEDDVYVHLHFPSGIRAHLHNSWLWPDNRRGLTVVGEKGMLVYDEVNQQVVHHRKTVDKDLQNVDLGEEIVFTGDGQPLALELQHFLDCCRDRTTPISDGASGHRVIEVLERIDAAATR